MRRIEADDPKVGSEKIAVVCGVLDIPFNWDSHTRDTVEENIEVIHAEKPLYSNKTLRAAIALRDKGETMPQECWREFVGVFLSLERIQLAHSEKASQARR